MKQNKTSINDLLEHERNCRICQSINEKGKAEKVSHQISHLNTNSNQPTPQIRGND